MIRLDDYSNYVFKVIHFTIRILNNQIFDYNTFYFTELKVFQLQWHVRVLKYEGRSKSSRPE